jgi:AcrR family transcriptional regulator
MSTNGVPRQRGPRRPVGAPVGPDEVRRAVLDAAARLFAERGVDAVPLREIAAEADVDLALIRRYVGRRGELVAAVFRDVSDRLAAEVAQHPLAGQGHGLDTVMGRWVRIAASLVISGRGLTARPDFNPVLAMADTLRSGYGLDPDAARVRAAQIVAAALGWRIFEDYLVEAGGLEDVPLAVLREELVHSARRLGATGWPSPPDPPVVGRLGFLS